MSSLNLNSEYFILAVVEDEEQYNTDSNTINQISNQLMKVLRKITPAQAQRTKVMCLSFVVMSAFAVLTNIVVDAQTTATPELATLRPQFDAQYVFGGKTFGNFLRQDGNAGFVDQYSNHGEHKMCTSPIFVPGMFLLGDAFLAIYLIVVLFYLFLGISVLMDIFLEAIHEITTKTESVEIQEIGSQKVVQVDVPVWNEQVANVTLIALGSSAPEIFLCFFSIFKDVDAVPDPTGPMVLVGSASFNMLIVTGVSILASVGIKKIENFGAFVVTAIFSCFAYLWFFIVLCVTTPGFITLWEALITLSMYFILVLCVFVTQKISLDENGANLHEQDENRRKICKHVLVGLAKQYGSYYVINLALNRPQKDDNTDEAERSRIRDYFMICLETDSLKDVAMQDLMDVLKKQNPIKRLGNGYRKQATKKKLPNMKMDDDDGCQDQKCQSVGFKFNQYACPESDNIEISIVKRVPHDVTFWVKTIDQSAYAGKDYEPKQELMTMKADEYEREFTIKIMNDNQPEGNETFGIALYDEQGDLRLDGNDTFTTVTILDNDKPGFLGFDQNEMEVGLDDHNVWVTVKRFEGTCGEASCVLRCTSNTQGDNAGVAIEEQVDFGNGHSEAQVSIRLPKCKDHSSNDEQFILTLLNPWPEDTIQLTRRNQCIVNLAKTEYDFQKERQQSMLKYYQRIEHPSWCGQFKNAIVFGPTVDDMGVVDEVTGWEALYHFLTIPWCVLFALVPPRKWCNGWISFIVAFFLIGCMSFLIAEFSRNLGCVADLRGCVQAIALIAIGTSLPDLLASYHAASDPRFHTADAAIANIFAANSANIFIGLGLPWTIACVYTYSKDGSAYFMGEMNTADLAFGIVMFAIASVMTFIVLGLRFAFTGGVLGGSTFVRYASAFFLFFCWFIFIALNTLNCYQMIGNRDQMMPYDIDLNAAQIGGTGCVPEEIVQPITYKDLGESIQLSWDLPAVKGVAKPIVENTNYDRCQVEFLTSQAGVDTWLTEKRYCDCNSVKKQSDGKSIFQTRSCSVTHAHLNRVLALPACSKIQARVRYESAGEKCAWSGNSVGPKIKGCPSKLADFRASLMTNNQVSLSWRKLVANGYPYGDGCNPIKTYEMEMKTAEGWVDINVKDTAKDDPEIFLGSQVTLKNGQPWAPNMKNRIVLEPCKFYQFRGRGLNDKCEGNYSSPFAGLSIPCVNKVEPLPQLGQVKVVAVGCGFRFSWSPPSVKRNEVSSLRYDISIQQGNGSFKSITNVSGCSNTSLACDISQRALRDFDLRPGQLITVRGRAGISRGWGMPGRDNYSGLTVLGAPQAFNRQPSVQLIGNSGVTVNWVSRQLAQNYQVEMTKNGALGQVKPTSSTFLAYNNLEKGVEYCFRVKATGTCGASGWSSPGCMSLQVPPPQAPVLSVIPLGCGITIRWSNVLAGSTFELSIRGGGAQYINLRECSSNGQNECQIAMSTLTNNQYGLSAGSFINLRARVLRSDGQYSSYGEFNTRNVQVVSKPLTVTNLRHTLNGSQGSLNWNTVLNADNYEVSDGSGLSQTTTDNSWPLENLVETVTYKVRASNVCGFGEWGFRTVTVDNLPGCMSVQASINDCKVRLRWAAPIKNGSAISSYKIQLSTSAGLREVSQCGQSGATSCSLTMDELIQTYNLNPSEQVRAVGTASNTYGQSTCRSIAPRNGPQVENYQNTASVNFSLQSQSPSSCSFVWSSLAGNQSSFTSIYWDGGSGGVYEQLEDTTGQRQFTKTGLNAGKSYRFKIQTATQCGPKVFSPEVSCSIIQPPPGQMEPVRASLVGCSAIKLEWTAPSYTGGSPIQQYRIEMQSGNSPWFEVNQCGTQFGTSCTVSISDLSQQNNQGSFIKVRGTAYNGKQWGISPSMASASGVQLLSKPNVPQAPGIISNTPDQITLTWARTSNQQSQRLQRGQSYKLYYCYNNNCDSQFGESYQLVSNSVDWSSSNSYTARDLVAGGTYYYKVAATNTCGTTLSLPAFLTLRSRPAMMSAVQIQPLGCRIQISWVAPQSLNGRTSISAYQLQIMSSGSWVEFTDCQTLNNRCNISIQQLQSSYRVGTGESLRIRIRASNSVGWAESWSPENSNGGYRVQNITPGRVNNLQIRTDTVGALSKQVSFTWNMVDADSYQFQQMDTFGSWRDYNSNGGAAQFSGSGIDVTLADPCQSSSFRVRAVKCSEVGQWSNTYTLDRSSVPAIMNPVTVREANCGVQINWQGPASGCGNVLSYKLEIQTKTLNSNNLVAWETLRECSNTNSFSCNVTFKQLINRYQMTESTPIRVRGYAQNATGWQPQPSGNNQSNGLRIHTIDESIKTILSLNTLTQEYVSFTWTSAAFDRNKVLDGRTDLIDHSNFYEVRYDEGDKSKRIEDFVVLATNLADTGYTYRNFETKYQDQDRRTGRFIIAYRFYVIARTACGMYPQSNLLEVMVSIRDKNERRQSQGLGRTAGLGLSGDKTKKNGRD